MTRQRRSQRPETARVAGGGQGCPPVRKQLPFPLRIRSWAALMVRRRSPCRSRCAESQNDNNSVHVLHVRPVNTPRSTIYSTGRWCQEITFANIVTRQHNRRLRFLRDQLDNFWNFLEINSSTDGSLPKIGDILPRQKRRGVRASCHSPTEGCYVEN